MSFSFSAILFIHSIAQLTAFGDQDERDPSKIAGALSVSSSSGWHLPRQPLRIWRDFQQKRETSATLIASDGEEAALEKTNGKRVTVPVAGLSLDDQKYIAQAIRVQRARQRPEISTARPDPASASPHLRSKDIASHRDTPSLGDALRQCAYGVYSSWREYGNAPVPDNMLYVRVSHSMLSRRIARDIDRHRAVKDVILGSSVYGTSRTTGRVKVVLHEDSRRVLAEMLFQGTTRFNVSSCNGPVRIDTTGTTTFSASKHLWLDHAGLHFRPASAQADTKNKVNCIDTSLPGLIGRISLRVAARREARSHALAESISARHCEQRVSGLMDRETEQNFAPLARKLASLKKIAIRPQGRSTRDYLQVILVGSGRPANFASPPTLDTSRPDLEVHIHASLVWLILSDAQLRASIREAIRDWTEQATASARSTTSKAPRTSTYRLYFSNNYDWLTLTWKSHPPAKNGNQGNK